MSVSVKCDLRAFNRALRNVRTATKKDGAEIVNRALKDVAFRAMQFTAFAEPGMIQAELMRDNIALKMAAARLKKMEGAAKTFRNHEVKLTKKGKIQKHGKVTQNKIKQMADKLISIRISRSKAIRAGWIKAVKFFGGSIRGAKEFSGGSTQKGGGVKASPSRLIGKIFNTLITRSHGHRKVPVEAVMVAQQGLQLAVDYVTRDKDTYARNKINKTLRIYSDK